MEKIIKYLYVAIAGAISLFAVLILAKPIFDAFRPLSEISSVPVLITAGLFLFAIALVIFDRILRLR